jgi:type IV secretory pathway VirB10-like protein
MATMPTPLTLHPVPQATQYNRLVQYGFCAAGTLIVVTYLTVMSSRGDKPQWERPDRFVTLNRPLITDVEKPPPPPPPQPLPELPPQTFPQATAAPPPQPANPQPNPDAERRKAALLKVLTAKVLVEAFYDADLRANQPRLQLAFKTLYFPNGYSLSLQGMPGMDSRGFAGLSDQVNRHFFQRYGTAAVLSLITAGISLASHGSRDRFYSYEPQDAATYGAGQVLGRAVAEDLRRAMQIRPTVTVREAYPFTLTVTQDVTFPGPYPFALPFAQGETE